MLLTKPKVATSWREKKEFIKKKKWKKTEKMLLSQAEEEALRLENSNDMKPELILNRAVQHLKTAPTLSIALPGSILDNAQTDKLRSYLASQIARAACIYNISEIIVYDDVCNFKRRYSDRNCSQGSLESCNQMTKILMYLECPQYLRKHLFPMCEELKDAGILNPLDAPHHLRATDECSYREGVITSKVSKSGTKSFADVGLTRELKVDQLLDPGERVTLRLYRSKKKNKLRGIVVSKDEPTKEEGLYWGYSVRLAKRLSDVFTESPYGEYDLTIGTSDKGEPWNQASLPELTAFKHALIVFGGLRGLEFALANDNKLTSVDNVSHLFEAYVNTCPHQGARTIRTEEALLISLALLTFKLGFGV